MSSVTALEPNPGLRPPKVSSTHFDAGVVSACFDSTETAWIGLADGSAVRWNGETRPDRWDTADSIVLAMAGCAEGCLAAGDSGAIRKIASGGVIQERALGRDWIEFLLHHRGSGKIVAVTARTVTLLDSFDGDSRIISELPGAPTGAALNYSGGTIALTHRSGFSLWDWQADTPVDHPMRGAVRALAWRPDGRYLCGPTQDGDLLLWQPAGDDEILLAAEGGRFVRPAWSADSRWLSATIEDRLFLWSFASPEDTSPPLREIEMPDKGIITGLAWHPALPTLAVGRQDGRVSVIALASGRNRVVPELSDSPVSVLSWSDGGDKLLVGTESGKVSLVSPPSDTP